ncbi:MAG: ABC transporter permease [Muribaculaceae bacterium]|nr:ABC transporter permease [Muribaculaceae bacterium]
MNGTLHDIKQWFIDLALVFRREMHLVVTDAGALIFFIGLPLLYPLVYTLIYNPEVVRDIPTVIVDNSRTARSRELVRNADATEAINVVGYATDMADARRRMNEKECYGIMLIPEDYSKWTGRGEQSHVTFYCEMSLLLRYRSYLQALTPLQLATGADIRTELISSLGAESMSQGATINAVPTYLGDTQQGFASFIIPGIIILILQQSMVLGITLLAGTSRDRRAANGGIDPLEIPASPSATLIGKMLTYVVIYLPMTIYVLHYVPLFFSLPHIGAAADYLLFSIPLLVASAFFGLTLQVLVKERETAFVVVVFTSAIFLFLSGLTWPRYATYFPWNILGDAIPAVWGAEGFVRINSNGATLSQQEHCFNMMWILAAIYFVTSYILLRIERRRICRGYRPSPAPLSE